MKKKLLVDCSVRVEPNCFRVPLEQTVRDCETIMDEIGRHVDNVRSVFLVKELEDVCEFCGDTWNEAVKKKEPNCCCDADIDDFNKRHAIPWDPNETNN